jgi:hypothetical protein
MIQLLPTLGQITELELYENVNYPTIDQLPKTNKPKPFPWIYIYLGNYFVFGFIVTTNHQIYCVPSCLSCSL